jgi:hypothetical protein
MYVNGVEQATTTSATNPVASTSSFTIGAWNTSNSYFPGYISNFRATAAAVYTSTFTPSTVPLTAISGTGLLTCQSNRFIDNSTNAFAITQQGIPSVQRFSPFSPTAAYSTALIGGSGSWNGTSDYLQATAGAVPAIGTGDFTISGWYYLNENKNYQIWFDFRNGSDMDVPYLYTTSSGAGDYYTGSSHSFSGTIIPKQWYYLVVSRVSGTTKAFLNGTQVMSYSDSMNYIAGRVTLGTNFGSGEGYYFNGHISDFKVVTGTGTTDGTPPTAPATATSGTQLLMKTTNGAIFDNAMMHDLQTVGNAQISTSVVKYGTGSMYFDGTGDYLRSAKSPDNILGKGDFTIEFWLYPLTLSGGGGGYKALVASENYSAVTGGWSFYQLNDGLVLWQSSGSIISAASSLTATTWQHVALCRASGTLRLFINGSSAASTSNSTDFTGQEIWVGDHSSGDYFFDGYMDDLRITRGFARYTTTFTPPTAALLTF